MLQRQEGPQVAPCPTLAMPSLCHALLHWADHTPERLAFESLDRATRVTWAAYLGQARELAGALHGLGVRAGGTVAMLLTNRLELSLLDAGAMLLRATPFSIYNTLPVEGVAYALSHSEATVLVTEQQYLSKVLAARPPGLKHIVLVDGEHPDCLGWPAFRATSPGAGFDGNALGRGARGDDVVTLIYTSGTTGHPKAVELTHDNMMAVLNGIAASLSDTPLQGRVISWLPAAHLADRLLAQYWSIAFGCTITHLSSPNEIAAALPVVRPTMFASVPRFYEKIRGALEAQGLRDPKLLPPEARKAVLQRLGLDSVGAALGGGAPMGDGLLSYFRDLGYEVYEVYGMSEASGFTLKAQAGSLMPGWIGPPMEGTETKLASDGELLIRGATLMRGYRKDPEKTAEAIDAEGWLHSGDLAERGAHGYYRIVGRKKELIINSAGKNMAPNNIEHTIKVASPLIGQAMVIGDRRPYNVALVVLDPTVAQQWASSRQEPLAYHQIAAHPEMRRQLCSALQQANEHLARVEQIKRFAVLGEDWLPGGDELTPTAKLKRGAIHEKYAELIEQLYKDESLAVMR